MQHRKRSVHRGRDLGIVRDVRRDFGGRQAIRAGVRVRCDVGREPEPAEAVPGVEQEQSDKHRGRPRDT